MTDDEHADPPPFDAAIPSSGLALPAAAHVPGSGSEPDWPALEVVKPTAPAHTITTDWRSNQAYIYGFALMRAGFYWEAHEVWEPVWLELAPNSRERMLLRALIQFANACLKTRMDRPRAAARLIEEVRRDLSDVNTKPRELLIGVNVGRLLEAVNEGS